MVLYSLPELDGAIDTVPLGGLVGDDIFLSGERVMALTGRLWKWINLRRKQFAERKIAVLMYDHHHLDSLTLSRGLAWSVACGRLPFTFGRWWHGHGVLAPRGFWALVSTRATRRGE